MISILILTRNEERDLPGCLASVSWSDDIHVFDSHSTDQTQQIAHDAGAHLHTRTFDDYATHRNAALATLPFKYPWVFLLDADERPTPELSREMQQLALASPPEINGFRLRRRDFLFDTWLKHAQISPFYIRLVRNQGLQNPSLRTALRDSDFHTRRLHQKALFYRMPGRPLIKWLYMMFVRRAILDGAAGLTYATLQSFYEYLIVLKTKELQRGGT